MKKIILIWLMFLISFSWVSATNVLVTAKVWNLNSKPIVISVNPSSNPRFLPVNGTQNYILYFQDDENDEITYTITPDTWFVTPTNGSIPTNEYDESNWAYINFLYSAPSTPNTTEKVIVTINDGTNVTIKQINLYIY